MTAKREPVQLPLPGLDRARAEWRQAYESQVPGEDARSNRSGIPIKPIYGPDDWDGTAYMDGLGYPGQAPFTRGIHPSMHRGRPWSQRQLIGLATPEDYNTRMRGLLDAGVTALSLIPCNSVYRGFDVDEVDIELLGTCGTTVNTVEDMEICLDQIPLDQVSVALNDPSPFTLLALMMAVAKRRGTPWKSLTGTSNQSDYLSHFIANHMFFRLALPGAKRVLMDHIMFMNREAPRWNPISVVGQHMQQGGATPAEAMGLTLSTAIQYANDLVERGLSPDDFLHRFSFFFDISISFFEEIAKFRAGRRVWTSIARDRFGAKDPKTWRFRFHAQTSGVDLTRQQPLNNIARTAVQAIAGIFGGLQSMHTDAWDEVLSTPSDEAARIAVATQNILREEAHLDDVIDPLGGSYYVERLTDQMEEEIRAVIDKIDAAGGMYAAAEAGVVQSMLGDSAMAFQDRVDSGEQTIVGVNKYVVAEDASHRPTLERPPEDVMNAQIARLGRFKAERSSDAVSKASDALVRAANHAEENVFGAIVDAADAGVTHGEICTILRRELGFGQPLVVA